MNFLVLLRANHSNQRYFTNSQSARQLTRGFKFQITLFKGVYCNSRERVYSLSTPPFSVTENDGPKIFPLHPTLPPSFF